MTGTCKFCGQQRLIDYDDLTEDVVNKFKDGADADFIATTMCICDAGRKFRNIEEMKEEAKENCRGLFQEVTESTTIVFDEIVNAIAAGDIKKSTIVLNERVTARIEMGKDSIKVTRTYKESNTIEAVCI